MEDDELWSSHKEFYLYLIALFPLRVAKLLPGADRVAWQAPSPLRTDVIKPVTIYVNSFAHSLEGRFSGKISMACIGRNRLKKGKLVGRAEAPE
jgi:hypothetical protein